MDIDLYKSTTDIHSQMMHHNDNSSHMMSFSGDSMLHYYDSNPNMTSSFPLSPSSASTSSSSQQNGNNKKQISMGAMREMIFRIAAMQPVHIDPESVKPPKRRNVRISKDPQSVAARHRRERISERIRILQRLVPGGTKMDTASMLDEAVHYVKFLKSQVQTLERGSVTGDWPRQPLLSGFPVTGGGRGTGGFAVVMGADQVAPTATQYLQQFGYDS